MPELTVDGRRVRVEPGTKVIRAAEAAGVFIPRFCYHPALGSVGACRICAVMFTQGPVEGLMMSCMVDARDGMVVATDHPEAIAFRRSVVEWLMMNHPHDCPVCDEGGHCLLQDLTVSGGHGVRRYPGLKRTFRNQYLGPLIQHEMNRCIQCYRCVRFYREYAGYGDLGVTGIASSLYFGRYKDGTLESPFSGNLIDICPTGVFTDKPSRYAVRRWDLQRKESVCLHCSLACTVLPGARYRKVHRVESRVSDEYTGPFICDRGRYGYAYTNRSDRPRAPRVDGSAADPERAVEAAASRLNRIMRNRGPGSVACLASPRASLETMALLGRLSQSAGWRPPEMFHRARAKGVARSAVQGLDEDIARSAGDLEQSDFLLLVGLDPVNEAPSLALSLRQAVRNGAVVAVLDPRPVSLPFAFDNLPVPARNLESVLGALIRNGLAHPEEPLSTQLAAFWRGLPESVPDCAPGRLKQIGQRLAGSTSPVLLSGPDVLPGAAPGFVAGCARFLASVSGSCGFFPVLPGPNGFGAALFDGLPERGAEDLVAEMERGEIRALVVAESDPLATHPLPERLQRALERLDLLVALDYLPSDTVARADVLLPARTVFEQEASFLSQAGEMRFANKIHEGGLPLDQLTGGGHPPRSFSSAVPGGDPQPAWRILADLARGMGLQDFPEAASARRPEVRELGLPLRQDGGRGGLGAAHPGNPGGHPLPPPSDAAPPGEFECELVTVDLVFGTEELSRYSPVLGELAPDPCVLLSAADAERMGLREGDTVSVPLPGGRLQAVLRTDQAMARGTMVVPRLPGLDWQLAEAEASLDLREVARVGPGSPGEGEDPA
jgi:NADH-quinone oxidoreductase subunit G